MSKVLDELVTLLALERIEENLFRGQSQNLGWGIVFGGQVLGQALSAATQTVPSDRRVHSMHAYFLRPGDANKPLVYDVDRIRDGGSFTTRRVVAIQSGEPIFNMAASFQIEEPGFEHEDAMPIVPAPETLRTEQERLRALGDRLPKWLRERAIVERPFETRPADDSYTAFLEQGVLDGPMPASRMVWIKTAGTLPDGPGVHRAMLAYASDHAFITTSLLPHAVGWHTPGMQVASLDHVMWFHEPFRADEWLLYAIESPKAHGARGLVRGKVFTQSGKLVASTAQEGLIRKREPR